MWDDEAPLLNDLSRPFEGKLDKLEDIVDSIFGFVFCESSRGGARTVLKIMLKTRVFKKQFAFDQLLFFWFDFSFLYCINVLVKPNKIFIALFDPISRLQRFERVSGCPF